MSEELLFLLIRAGLGTMKSEDTQQVSSLLSTSPDWPSVYRLSVRQGVVAIARDGLERLLQSGVVASAASAMGRHH